VNLQSVGFDPVIHCIREAVPSPCIVGADISRDFAAQDEPMEPAQRGTGDRKLLDVFLR
jgi:hypothetical protein